MFLEIKSFPGYWFCKTDGEIYSDKKGELVKLSPDTRFKKKKAYVFYREKEKHVVLYEQVLISVFGIIPRQDRDSAPQAS